MSAHFEIGYKNSSISVTISIVSRRVSNLRLNIGEGCLCCLCRNCLAVSFVSSVDHPPPPSPSSWVEGERGYPLFQAHITFNHPLGRPAGQPPTDHIQPPRYPLPVPACLLPILQPRLGSALKRPRVCRSIYLNVLSRFVLITLPENTHTHTRTHTSCLSGHLNWKACPGRFKSHREQSTTSRRFIVLFLLLLFVWAFIALFALFLACAAINPFAATSKCARVVAHATL